MKSLSLYSAVLLIVLTACFGGEKAPPVDKALLFGKMEGGTYSNEFFNIQIRVGDDWKIEERKFQTRLAATLLDAGYYFEENDTPFPDVSFEIEIDKANPFGTPSVKEQLEESAEGLEFIYGSDEIVREPLQKVNLGGQEYVLARIKLTDESGTVWFDEYMRYQDKYFLSITANYPEENQEMIQGLLDAIRPLK